MELFGEYYGLRELVVVALGGAMGCAIFWAHQLIKTSRKKAVD